MLADIQTGVLAGRAMVRETARAHVSGDDRRIAPSAIKLFCTEMVGQVADLAVQVHGGAGYMREIPVERIYRDVRLLRLYEGTSEIQRLIIGERPRPGRVGVSLWLRGSDYWNSPSRSALARAEVRSLTSSLR